MNQVIIGGYLAQKRRAQNLTQEQLAECLGVSNKTISKWENGRSMPDYSILPKLCQVLRITLPELMNGRDEPSEGSSACDEEQMLDMLRRMQTLEKQKSLLYGLVLIVLGIACSAMANLTGGTDAQDFLSGLLMGVSVAVMLAGIGLVGKTLLAK
ncbi:MAG: helix-turn-helix transcriptional regulator [Clostridia bacterium]|nr:helix-turn-helix transcriptional regulator [Clostridia bacterium]